MSRPSKGSSAVVRTELSYQLLRNTTSPDELENEIKSFIVNLPAAEILKLGTDLNLRDYIPEYSAKRRTHVHDKIRATIESDPLRFITRNSGFVISASDIEVDDTRKLVRLTDASILNGAQSQGEIAGWIVATYGDDRASLAADPPFHVRAEIIVEADQQQVVETAIARNTATPVKSISQARARGHLTDLEKSVHAVHPNAKFGKAESDFDVLDMRKVIQYARLLMPTSISGSDTPAERLRPYKNPEQCLSDFSDWFEKKGGDADAKRKYEFTVQMAPIALAEYEYWERHSAWNGQRVWEETKKGGRACRRDKSTQKIVWVSPGLIFPVLGALSEFVTEVKPDRWALKKPKIFNPADMIKNAVTQFRSVGSDPMQMGRHAGAYDALRTYPATIVQVMAQMEGHAS
jgi:hypothetical protein